MLKILVVEDDISIGLLLHETLSRAGYQVTSLACSAAEALASAEQCRPDYAVIDLHLSNGDLGIDVASQLRALGDIGVMFSTGNDDGSLTQAQGNAVMLKPYQMRDVDVGLMIIDEVRRNGRTDVRFPRNFRMLQPVAERA